MVVFIADDLGFLGPGIPDLVTELYPPQDTAWMLRNVMEKKAWRVPTDHPWKNTLWTNTGQDWNVFRELWAPLVHTNFRGNSYGPIIGPYEFLGKFVCTNGPESSSKVPPTLALVHGWLFPATCRTERNAWLRKPQICNVQIRNLAVLEQQRELGEIRPLTSPKFPGCSGPFPAHLSRPLWEENLRMVISKRPLKSLREFGPHIWESRVFSRSITCEILGVNSWSLFVKRDSVNLRHLASFSVIERHVVATDVALQVGISPHTQKHTNVHIY